MTKLDQVIARLRALPEPQQEALAAEIAQLLDEPETDPDLSPEQLADIRARLAAPKGVRLSHEDVIRAMEGKYGR